MKPSTLFLLVSFSVASAGVACSGNVVLDSPTPTSASSGNGAGGLPSTGSMGGQGGLPFTSSVGPGPGQGGAIGVGSISATSTSSTGGPPVQVACNGGQCATGEICCFNPNGTGDHCGTHGQCDPGFVELTCGAPSDCPGSICCATVDNQQKFKGIACQASCSGPNELIVCTKMTANICPMGTACHHSMQLGNGYRLCF